MRNFLFFLVLSCTMMAFLPEGVQAGEVIYPEMMLILDASGSMSGKVGAEVKIDAARKVFAQIVPSIPAEVKIGLTAYGHNRKGDCKDIEILVSPGAADRRTILEKINSIQPKGKTPIADSIVMVAEQLKQKEGETTIVLVSDGEETCNPDPCAVVKSLKSSGIKFVLHVVGFDVNAKQKDELTCLAREGGGNYYSAGDSASLLMSLQAVKKTVEVKVEQAKVTTRKAATGLGKLQITIPEKGLIILHTLKIVRESDDKVIKTIEGLKNDSLHPLPAGKYKLVAGFGNVNNQPDSEVSFGSYEIAGGETTAVNLGVLTINIAKKLEKMATGAVIVTRPDQPEFKLVIGYYDNDYYLYKPKPLPAGVYDLSVHYKRSYLYKTEETPVPLVTGIAVPAGGEAVAALDSGIYLKKPQSGGLESFELMPKEGSWGPMKIQTASNGDHPLWQIYAVPPGIYGLQGYLEGMSEPLLMLDSIEIRNGDLLELDTGL